MGARWVFGLPGSIEGSLVSIVSSKRRQPELLTVSKGKERVDWLRTSSTEQT
jgi:hypothetical protein